MWLHAKSRIETIELVNKIFGNTRTLRIYIPKEYDEKKEFKVLYLNDGQNLFVENESDSGNKWFINKLVDSLIMQNKIEPLIIVGIDNADNDRANEYLPWNDIYLSPPVQESNGKKYPEFHISEVMPVIEKKYKILKGKENTGIGGASYGGLIALYSILVNPDHFEFALIESPSLYVDNHKIMELANYSISKWKGRIYLGIGINELGIAYCEPGNVDNEMAVSDVQKLHAIISEGSPLTAMVAKIDSCAVHNESAWSNRFPMALEFLVSK